MSTFQHRLLKRQLKKAQLSPEVFETIEPLLQQIDAAYNAFDNDLAHIETILEKSSQELFQVNQQLKNSVETIAQRLARVVDNIQEVIFEIDLNGNWSYLNPAWEKLTGYTVRECLNKPYYNFLKKDEVSCYKDLIDLQDQTFDFIHQNIEIITHDLQKKWFEFSIKSIKNKHGEIEGYIGTITDITQRKEVEFALIKAKEKETQANKAKDDFLSTMSHEIRTPLNAVIGISYLLLSDNPKDEQLENLNTLKYSSEHLLGLVNDILDFSKIESGALELEESSFNIEHIIDSLQSIFRARAEEKNIRFTIKKDDLLPDAVIGDSTRISQILTNLISNAIKFTNQGKVVLDIEVAHQAETHVELDFCVKDTGIGISAEKKHKIFNPFVQANSDTTRKYGGTGLGLAICKRLLEKMNSKLVLESAIGHGSTFSFSLKLEVGTAKKLPTYSSSLAVYPNMTGIKVLVVEDHKVNIMVIKQFLQRWDVSYDIAENGQIAVDKAAENNYDLVLMDIQMPVMNGYDATKAIRNSSNINNQSIPIYALSASTGKDTKKEVQKYGMNGHISKPFDPKELYQTLQRVVKKNAV